VAAPPGYKDLLRLPNMSDVDAVPDASGANLNDIETRWRTAGARPATGAVRLLVVRTGGGRHVRVQRLRLDPATGIDGDRWSAGDRDPDDQVSLMDARVVEALAGAGGLDVPGDNLIVDLDLGEQALPFGSRLQVGTAVIQLSGKLHAGCKKFRARLGDQALRWVNAKVNQPLRLRGLYARILQAGEVAVGDLVRPLP
jgi:hypothetical protein